MMQKKNIINIIFCALLVLIAGVSITFNFSKIENTYAEATHAYAESQNEFPQPICYNEFSQPISYDGVYENNVLNAQEPLGFKPYTKGLNEVNVLFTFVNYENDETNHLNKTEISEIMTTLESEVTFYFERMSQNFVNLNFDYFCTIAPNSYDYYLNKSSPSYTEEKKIFYSGMDNMLDYDGNKKECKFDSFNVMINVFAGNSGKWNTFLWPHAYTGNSLIMMTEYKQMAPISSATLCHEMLHIFGVGDLYSYSGSQNFSAQNLDIMATGTKNQTTNAYFRKEIGWINSSVYGDNETTSIEEVLWGNDVTLNLYPCATNDYSKTIAYKFGVNENNGEYFVIEYKIKSYQGIFDNIINNSAVVIYRVNEKGFGNAYCNMDNSPCEVLFMGDSSLSISSYDYTKTCLLVAGSTYGNTGSVGNTSLVYSSAGGKDNLFNGENSQIVIKVNSLSDEFANISIDFAEGKQTIDMSTTKWNQSSTINYDSTTKIINLINIPSVVTVTYSGTTSAITPGKYTTVATLTYDSSLYNLINCNFEKEFIWQIIPAEITVKIDDKTSKYGESLLPLTYSLTNGKLYGQDKLNISLKLEKTNVGKNTIQVTNNEQNYNITFIDGYYTISPRIIGVRVFNQAFNINNFTGIKQNEYEILSGFDSILSGDNLTISLEVANLSPSNPKAGKYEINAIGNNENYKLQVETGILSVYHVVNMSAVKWNYEKAINYNALQHEVKLLNLPNEITVTYDGNNKAINAGEYSVSAILNYDNNTTKLENFNISTTINWKINKAYLYITIHNKTSKYGYVQENLTYTLTNGTIYSNNAKITLQKDSGTNVGTYNIYANCNNDNYEIIYNIGKYIISQRIVNIELLNQSYAIDEFNGIKQDEYKLSITSEEIVEGDNLNIQIRANMLNKVDVGKYELTATANNPNYQVNFTSATLEIKASTKPIFIMFIIIASVLAITIIWLISSYFIKIHKSNSWKDVD